MLEHIHWRPSYDTVTFALVWTLHVPGKNINIQHKIGPRDIEYYDDEVFAITRELQNYKLNLTFAEKNVAFFEYLMVLYKVRRDHDK